MASESEDADLVDVQWRLTFNSNYASQWTYPFKQWVLHRVSLYGVPKKKNGRVDFLEFTDTYMALFHISPVQRYG